MLKTARLTLLLGALFQVTGCGMESGSVTSDIGADFDYKNVYYIDGGNLVRGYCPNDIVVINRVNCGQPQQILAWVFYEYSETRYLTYIEQAESKVNQLVLQISELDVKILMMLQGAAGYDQSLLPQIRQKEAALTAAEMRLAGVRDQILRIEAQLAQSEDPDLRQLLHDQQRQLESTLIERAKVRADLFDLRKRHLDANNGIISVDTYRRLISQRENAVGQHGFAESSLAFEVSRFGGYLSAIKFLKDSSVWDFSVRDPWGDMVSRAVGEFAEIWLKLHAGQIFSEWDGVSIRYLVARPQAKMWDFEYTNLNTAGNCTGLKIEHKNFTLIHNDNHLYVDRDDNVRYPHLAKLFSSNVSGKMKITPICSGPIRAEDITGQIVVIED